MTDKKLDTEEERVLKFEILDAHQWRGLSQLAEAFHDFEPLARRSNLGAKVADALVQAGYAEKGPPTSNYAGLGYDVGYRLTELGWKLLNRGRAPKRSR